MTDERVKRLEEIGFGWIGAGKISVTGTAPAKKVPNPAKPEPMMTTYPPPLPVAMEQERPPSPFYAKPDWLDTTAQI
jgi:hypothetical protein